MQFDEERSISKFKVTNKAAVIVKQMSTDKEKPGSLHYTRLHPLKAPLFNSESSPEKLEFKRIVPKQKVPR